MEPADLRSLLAWTTPCGLVGAALAIFGNVAHPTMPMDAHAALSIVAAHGAWTWIHFAVILAAVLILFSLRGVLELARRSPAAQLGFVAATLGAAVLTVAFGIDGFTTKAVSDIWAAAGPAEQPTLLLIAHTVELLHTGLFYLWLPLFLGAPPFLFGLAFWGAGRRVLSVWGVASGVACLAIGVWCFLARQFAVELPSLVAAFATVLWFLAANVAGARTFLALRRGSGA